VDVKDPLGLVMGRERDLDALHTIDRGRNRHRTRCFGVDVAQLECQCLDAVDHIDPISRVPRKREHWLCSTRPWYRRCRSSTQYNVQVCWLHKDGVRHRAIQMFRGRLTPKQTPMRLQIEISDECTRNAFVRNEPGLTVPALAGITGS